MKKKIMVIAAHPDDELLGCGATLAKLSEKGHEIKTIILGQGMIARNEKTEELEELRKDAQKANASIGIKALKFYDFPDNAVDRLRC